MRSLDSACSMRTARIASLTLRSIETSLVSRKFLATCCVMVDAPIGRLAAAIHHVVDRGPHDVRQADAGMRIEALVLGGQEGVDDPLGDRVHRHEEAPLDREFGQHAAVAGVDARQHRRLIVDELLVVRQPAAEMPQRHEHAAGADQRHEHEHDEQADESSTHSGPAALPLGTALHGPDDYNANILI